MNGMLLGQREGRWVNNFPLPLWELESRFIDSDSHRFIGMTVNNTAKEHKVKEIDNIEN